MFNPIEPADMVVAIGRAARSAARSADGTQTAFDQAQLLSAYSASRHIAAELTRYGPPLEAFREAILAQLRQAIAEGAPGVAGREELADVETALANGHAAIEVGAAVATLLEILRRADAPWCASLQTTVRQQLRALAEAEVDALASEVR
ncbi:MAG: hypothetical protein JWQ18_587 [Conexibacter sp.]|nr:hypothetical protein [Conexibacter sp.]